MKKSILTAALSILMTGFLTLPGFTQNKIEKEWKMKQYFMVFLSVGPDRMQDSITKAKIMEGHLNNISRLFEEKKLVLAGPFMDDGDVVGIFILDAPTKEEAVKLTESDPAVKAGRLKYEIRPWYGPGKITVSGE
jgi:uncharacterized protein